ERGDEDVELVAIPAVVLVGERDQLRRRRGEPDRALEVAEEAEPLVRAADEEAGIAGDRALELRERLRRRAVVADHADPVVAGRLADRAELDAEPVGVGLPGRHADRDPPPDPLADGSGAPIAICMEPSASGSGGGSSPPAAGIVIIVHQSSPR